MADLYSNRVWLAAWSSGSSALFTRITSAISVIPFLMP